MADRPIECTNCKKQIKVIYQEVVDDVGLCSEMCADCPLLQQKLRGKNQKEQENKTLNVNESLCCGHCHTCLDAIRMGNPLGCSECYNVFADAITSELAQTDRVPSILRKNILGKKNQSLHFGKSPHLISEVQPAAKLSSLHEALNEALKKENYEQAAWIRDQIKTLIAEKTC